jgi:hypothetical protein
MSQSVIRSHPRVAASGTRSSWTARTLAPPAQYAGCTRPAVNHCGSDQEVDRETRLHRHNGSPERSLTHPEIAAGATVIVGFFGMLGQRP